MPWYCAKTIGRETVAKFYLERAGLQAFRPVIERYFTDRRTGSERSRVVSLIPGYVFIWLASDAERDMASSATGVAYILGSWNGTLFKPREMPSQWMSDLLESGPIVEGKRVTLRKGDKAAVAVAGIGKLICEVEAVDNSRSAVVYMEMFGAVRRVSVALERLDGLAGQPDSASATLPAPTSRNERRRQRKATAEQAQNSSMRSAVNA